MLKRFLIFSLLVFVAIAVQAQVVDTLTFEKPDTTLIDTTSVQTLIAIDDDDEETSLDEEDYNIPIDSLLIYTEGEFPAHKLYKIWQTNQVNPYDVRLVDMPDTVAINLAGYCHPIRNVVTSNFGFRKWRYHYGIDLRVKRGDSIFCSFDGMVRIARYSKSYGYFVIVRHYNGLETTYAHLSKLFVKPEQIVKAGELLGWGGSTGRSSGPHLHYELRYLGVPINPNDIVDFQTYTTHDSTLYLNASHFDYVKEIEKIRVWTVRKGDTLGGISRKTGVSINTLCRLNNISTKTILKIGRKLRYT
jgi:Membrane proteins related to metalloendopeptidases